MIKEIYLGLSVSLYPTIGDSIIESHKATDTGSQHIRTDYTTTTYNFITTQQHNRTSIINLLKEIENHNQNPNNRQSEQP
jgi:hypothetical protein